jgi:hypothetical protein
MTITNRKGGKGSPISNHVSYWRNWTNCHSPKDTIRYPRASFLPKTTFSTNTVRTPGWHDYKPSQYPQTTPGSPDLILLSKHSLAMSTESSVCLPSTKAFWGLRNNHLHYPSQLVSKDFGNDLINYTYKTNKQKSLRSIAPDLFGMRAMNMALRLFSNLLFFYK